MTSEGKLIKFMIQAKEKLMFVLYDRIKIQQVFCFKVVLHKWRMRVIDLG